MSETEANNSGSDNSKTKKILMIIGTIILALLVIWLIYYGITKSQGGGENKLSGGEKEKGGAEKKSDKPAEKSAEKPKEE